MSQVAPAHDHAVQFYDTDDFLVVEVAAFLAEGLADGESAVVVATPPHREGFAAELAVRGIDVRALVAEGRLVLADAMGTMSQLIFGGRPDRERFERVVDGMLERCQQRSHNGRVRVFGEMVDLLWRGGQRAAALELEELWNEARSRRDFSLLCTYIGGDFHREEQQRVIERHGLVRPDERVRRIEAEHRLEMLIDSIEDYAVFMLDPSGHIQTWNRGAERIKGWSASEIVGRHFSVFYAVDQLGRSSELLRIAACEGRVEDVGWRVRKDGSRFWANVVITAVRDSDGRLRGFAKVTRDLTERKQAEQEAEARRAAEEANRSKDEFLAMLGHELRNPLAPIVTALQVMKLRGDVRSSREQQIIERQVKHMVRLVDDLLDVSRITRGKIEIKKHQLDLRDVVARAVEVASPLLEQRRHHFDVEVAPVPILVDGDEARLAQVFSNLITNAAKYTPPGGHIVVEVGLDELEATVEVRDDGMGIAEALLPHIFEPFVQGAQSPERSLGGLGIGLSLVRSLVELHDGRVRARSAGIGEGASFIVSLPLATHVCMPADVSDALLVALPGSCGACRVLVVDDNEDALELLAEILRSVGHDVCTAADGPQALEAARRFQPQVAVLDIGLPVMDGYDLAQRLRSEHGEDAPRLIALSGYGLKTDRARSSEAGFVLHLVKPIDARELLEAIVVPGDGLTGPGSVAKLPGA